MVDTVYHQRSESEMTFCEFNHRCGGVWAGIWDGGSRELIVMAVVRNIEFAGRR